MKSTKWKKLIDYYDIIIEVDPSRVGKNKCNNVSNNYKIIFINSIKL